MPRHKHPAGNHAFVIAAPRHAWRNSRVSAAHLWRPDGWRLVPDRRALGGAGRHDPFRRACEPGPMDDAHFEPGRVRHPGGCH